MHVFATGLAELAERVEQGFFRIERENRWAASLMNGLIAGIAVGVVAWLVMSMEQDFLELNEADLLLFACLGSSSASVVFAPVAKTNSLRSIILAYLASAVVCVLLFPLHKWGSCPLPIQCFLAVTISIFLMRLIDAMHPAAVGSAMAFIIYERNLASLILLLLAIVGLLTVVKLLAYIYLEELRFRNFSREIRREYYGNEMTLTIVRETGTLTIETTGETSGGNSPPDSPE